MDEKTIIVMAAVEDDQAEAAKGGNIMTERQPTADEIAGMAWWNSMTERERGIALQLAKANTVAEAWDWQKQMLATQEGIDDLRKPPTRT